MRKKSYLAFSLLCLLCLNTITVNAEVPVTQNQASTTVYIDGGDKSSTTGGSAILSIPATIELNEDTTTNTFTDTEQIYVYGQMSVQNAMVSVTAPTTATFTNEDNTKNVTGNITFGNTGKATWNYSELYAGVAEDGTADINNIKKEDFVITVDNASEIEVDNYTAPITFNIAVEEDTSAGNYFRNAKGIYIDGKFWSFTPTKYMKKTNSDYLYLDNSTCITGVDSLVVNNSIASEEDFNKSINWKPVTGTIKKIVYMGYPGNTAAGEADLYGNSNIFIKTAVFDIDTTYVFWKEPTFVNTVYFPDTTRSICFNVSRFKRNSNMDLYYYGSATHLLMALFHGTNTKRAEDTDVIINYATGSTNGVVISNASQVTGFWNYVTLHYWDSTNEQWATLPSTIISDAITACGNAYTSDAIETAFPADSEGAYEASYKAFLSNYGINE